MTHVLHVPGLAINILSVKKIIDFGAHVLLSFGNRLFKWQFTDDSSFIALHKDVLFPVAFRSPTSSTPPLSLRRAVPGSKRTSVSATPATTLSAPSFPEINKPDGHVCIACQLTKTPRSPWLLLRRPEITSLLVSSTPT